MKDLIEIENCYDKWPDTQPGCGDAVVAKINQAAISARDLIDNEWKRVKQGEPAYNKVRRWLVPGSLLIIALFIVAAMLINFE